MTVTQRRIEADDLAAFAVFLKRESGITLDASKGYLVETRLASLMQREGIGSFAELTRRGHVDAALRAELVDAMTTNETSFFRDPKIFDLLAHKLIPDHFERRGLQAPLRIWSAASSSGQEIYSVAMIVRELLGPLGARDVQLVGTDISPSMLAQASRGVYTAHEVSRGLSERRRAMHFIAEGPGRYRVKDELRGLATFEQLNLLDPKAATRFAGRFDIVLCRNVAIYFDDAGRRQLWSTVEASLGQDATLLLGSTETLRDAGGDFERCEFRGVGYYRARRASTSSSQRPAASAGRFMPGSTAGLPAPSALQRPTTPPRPPVGPAAPPTQGMPRAPGTETSSARPDPPPAEPVIRRAAPLRRAPSTAQIPMVVGRALGVPLARAGRSVDTDEPSGRDGSPRSAGAPSGSSSEWRRTAVYAPVRPPVEAAPGDVTSRPAPPRTGNRPFVKPEARDASDKPAARRAGTRPFVKPEARDASDKPAAPRAGTRPFVRREATEATDEPAPPRPGIRPFVKREASDAVDTPAPPRTGIRPFVKRDASDAVETPSPPRTGVRPIVTRDTTDAVETPTPPPRTSARPFVKREAGGSESAPRPWLGFLRGDASDDERGAPSRTGSRPLVKRESSDDAAKPATVPPRTGSRALVKRDAGDGDPARPATPPQRTGTRPFVQREASGSESAARPWLGFVRRDASASADDESRPAPPRTGARPFVKRATPEPDAPASPPPRPRTSVDPPVRPAASTARDPKAPVADRPGARTRNGVERPRTGIVPVVRSARADGPPEPRRTSLYPPVPPSDADEGSPPAR